MSSFLNPTKPERVSLVALVVSVLSAYDIATRLAPYTPMVSENEFMAVFFAAISFPVMSALSFIYDDYTILRRGYVSDNFIKGYRNALDWYLYIPSLVVIFFYTLFGLRPINTDVFYIHLNTIWDFKPTFITGRQKENQDQLVTDILGMLSVKASKRIILFRMAEWMDSSMSDYYRYADYDMFKLQQDILVALGDNSEISWERLISFSEAMVRGIKTINLHMYLNEKARAERDWNDNFNNSSHQNYRGKSEDSDYYQYKEQSYSETKTESRLTKYFRILEVSESASYEEVRTSYRKLMKANHPDRFFNASEAEQKKASAKTQEITAAWEYAKDYFGKK